MRLNKNLYFFMNCFIMVLTIYFGTSALMTLHAEEIPVRVTLDSIEIKKPSEQAGDEIYINITQYSNQGQSKTFRIPEAPMHWLSKDLSEVKDRLIWTGTVRDQEEMKVIFSVVEQDTPPWDLDDLIGSALLVLENTGGQLKYRWELPVFEERVDQEMMPASSAQPGESTQQFVMRGDNSNYKVNFKVYADKLIAGEKNSDTHPLPVEAIEGKQIEGKQIEGKQAIPLVAPAQEPKSITQHSRKKSNNNAGPKKSQKTSSDKKSVHKSAPSLKKIKKSDTINNDKQKETRVKTIIKPKPKSVNEKKAGGHPPKKNQPKQKKD